MCLKHLLGLAWTKWSEPLMFVSHTGRDVWEQRRRCRVCGLVERVHSNRYLQETQNANKP